MASHADGQRNAPKPGSSDRERGSPDIGIWPAASTHSGANTITVIPKNVSASWPAGGVPRDVAVAAAAAGLDASASSSSSDSDSSSSSDDSDDDDGAPNVPADLLAAAAAAGAY